MSLVDLYANIALESLFDSAGECRCEQPTHEPAYPCTVDVLYLLRYGCTGDPAIKVCENIFRECLEFQRTHMPCPCGLQIRSCWSLIPI